MARPVKGSLNSMKVSLNYLVDTGVKPVTSSGDPGSGPTERTGKYEERMVTVHNGRPHSNGFSLEREGFVFVDHETRVTDFYNEKNVRSIYYTEMIKLIKDVSGASRVLIFDHTLRAADDKTREEKNVRGPVKAVHNDYTEWSGPQRVRDLLPVEEAEELLVHRFGVVQVWRPIRNPVQTTPLAIADARSLTPNDMIPAERKYPDRVGEIYHLTFNSSHRWFYFPNMQRNEALVFKCYDSEKDGRARWTAHAAFENSISPLDAPARESIEIRALVFFSPAALS